MEAEEPGREAREARGGGPGGDGPRHPGRHPPVHGPGVGGHVRPVLHHLLESDHV